MHPPPAPMSNTLVGAESRSSFSTLSGLRTCGIRSHSFGELSSSTVFCSTRSSSRPNHRVTADRLAVLKQLADWPSENALIVADHFLETKPEKLLPCDSQGLI